MSTAEIIALIGACTTLGVGIGAVITQIRTGRKTNGETRSLVLGDIINVNRSLVKELERVVKARKAFEAQAGASSKTFEAQAKDLGDTNQSLQAEVKRLGEIITSLKEQLKASDAKVDGLEAEAKKA